MTNEIYLPLLLIALPLMGSALAMIAKAFLTGKRSRILEFFGAAVGLALPWIVLVQSLPIILGGELYSGVIGGWTRQVGIGFRFDGLAWLVSLMGFTVASASWIYTLGKGPKGAGFTSVFLIQTAALAATSMTADIFNLFVCLEVMGLASYVLVASSEKPGAILASFSYLIISATAMVFFLLGIYGLYRLTGTLSYMGIAETLKQLPQNGGITAIVSLALIIGAVAIRVAIMPVYGWLPDAHALAPHGVSAILSGVLIKSPLFALSRVILLLPAGALASQLMGYAGAITALLAVILALAQSDAKRLLAYHSVSQIGYVVCAWGAGLYLGPETKAGATLMAAAFLHAFFHALFKGLLFLSIGTVTDAAGERNVYKLRGAAAILRKNGERFPLTMIAFFTAALAITAIPPMNGYTSKAALSYALKGSWEYYLLFAASIGTVASFIKLSRIFFGTTSSKTKSSPSGAAVGVSQLFLALAVVGSGITGGMMFRFVVRMFSSGAAIDHSYNPQFIPGLKLYDPAGLLNTLFITAAGILLYLITRTVPAKGILTSIRERQHGFHGLMSTFVFGILALSMWMFFSIG